MSRICFPPKSVCDILCAEAKGGEPSSLSLVAPTITRPQEPFDFKLCLVDKLGYPCCDYDGQVKVTGEFAGAKPIEVSFSKGKPALVSLEGVEIGGEGRYRFRAELEGKSFYSNPTACRAGEGHRVFWGDPHIHSVLSDCHPDKCRSLDFCFTAARYLGALDWCSAADHVSNGRCDAKKWRQQMKGTESYNRTGEFVTLPAYEASLQGGKGGDNNVYLDRAIDMYIDEYEEGSVKTLSEKLAAAAREQGFKFFVVPHHTTRTGKHGEIGDDIYPGGEYMPLIEIHSKWGSSEYRGNPMPLQEVHDGPSYARDLLAKGMKLGFIGGSDTHATLTFCATQGVEPGHIDRPTGLTAVRVAALNREEVFKGLAARRCYATSGERILLDCRMNGAGMGAVTDAAQGPRRFEISAAAAGEIDFIVLVRNGEEIASEKVGDWQVDVELADEAPLADSAYYYARVDCASGARAWSSPIWLADGR